MSCTLVNRLRVRLTVPSLAKSAVAELCVSPPGVESSEPTLDTDDVLEREWEASESMAGEWRQDMFANAGAESEQRATRTVFIAGQSINAPAYTTRPRPSRERVLSQQSRDGRVVES